MSPPPPPSRICCPGSAIDQALTTQAMKDGWTIQANDSKLRIYGILMQFTLSSNWGQLNAVNRTLAHGRRGRRSHRYSNAPLIRRPLF